MRQNAGLCSAALTALMNEAPLCILCCSASPPSASGSQHGSLSRAFLNDTPLLFPGPVAFSSLIWMGEGRTRSGGSTHSPSPEPGVGHACTGNCVEPSQVLPQCPSFKNQAPSLLDAACSSLLLPPLWDDVHLGTDMIAPIKHEVRYYPSLCKARKQH